MGITARNGTYLRRGLFKAGLVIVIVLALEILLGALPLVIPYQIVILSMVLIAMWFLLSIRLHWGYFFLIASVPITNVKFAIYPPYVTLFNVLFIFHIIVIMVCISLFFNRAANKTGSDFEYDVVTILIFFFLFWAFVGILWAPDRVYSSFKYLQLLLCVIGYFLLRRLLNTRKDLIRAYNVWIGMGIIASFVLLLSLLLKDQYTYIIKGLSEIIPVNTDSISQAARTSFPEPGFFLFFSLGNYSPARGSGFAEPKFITNFINLAVLIAIGSMTVVRNRKQKIILVLAILFMVFSHLFAQTKGPLGGLLLAIAFLLVALPSLRKNLITSMTSFGFALFIVFFLFMSSQVIVRNYHDFGKKTTGGSRITSTDQSAESIEMRIGLWKDLFNMIDREKAHFSGMGTGGSGYYVEPLPHPHSFFLSIFYDFGFMGLIGFIVIVAVLFNGLIKVLRSEDSEYRTMACTFYAGLLSFGISGLLEFDYFIPLIWVFLGVGMSIYDQLKKQHHADL